MAADQSAGWANLPDKVVHEIYRRIPCEVDRHHAGRVCLSWRVALAKLKPPVPPAPLPWLLLPEADGEHRPTFSCVLRGWRSTHPFFLPIGARRARYFGSYNGVWLFLAVDVLQGDGKAEDHLLINLHSFQFVDLPNAMRVPIYQADQGLQNIAIVAAALSRPPTERGCVVAGIIELAHSPPARRVAFWRMGDRVVPRHPWAEWPPEEVEDLLYTTGAFIFLTKKEDIRVCREPAIHKDFVQLQLNLQSLVLFRPRGRDGQMVLGRYLVHSRRDVLLVVRLAAPLPYDQAAVEFRVFESKKYVQGKYTRMWNALSGLDGRILFVGRGCSRSYEEADGYPGMEGVYFLDDHSSRRPIVHGPRHACRCSDNGKWSEASLRIDRCFPERAWSKCSPPVWIIP
ncbi:uncharacterized protein LOC102713913 [Oryza brachyantha]|uniref:KIB1-4 beta-propeller domain-containing protein n=1 Tax=Oryza brachyantha TaxID=4533 RepID=J3M992_ORYBR|nr:uncharacterized protein LOC102713913 [Oryza brachyantha]